jgi:hypothetical protein
VHKIHFASNSVTITGLIQTLPDSPNDSPLNAGFTDDWMPFTKCPHYVARDSKDNHYHGVVSLQLPAGVGNSASTPSLIVYLESPNGPLAVSICLQSGSIGWDGAGKRSTIGVMSTVVYISPESFDMKHDHIKQLHFMKLCLKSQAKLSQDLQDLPEVHIKVPTIDEFPSQMSHI